MAIAHSGIDDDVGGADGTGGDGAGAGVPADVDADSAVGGRLAGASAGMAGPPVAKNYQQKD